MPIAEAVLEEIRSRVSIVDVVGQHVTLKRAGKNWKGLCPFHSEKTPSFVVNDERGTYHCFGCGAGGNVFRFLMEAEGSSFPEAVQALAERAGVLLEAGPEEEKQRALRQRRDQLREILDLAARYYRHQLLAGRAGEAARQYLQRREIPATAAERFGLGCAPAGWDNLTRYLRKRGAPLELAVEAGLILPRRNGGGHYDRLRERLVFPIQDAPGRVVSFGGRVLGDAEPKYLNGPESPLFHKGQLLYGLHQGTEGLRRGRRALLVEGYLDVISLHARGEETALATLGTALTAEHVQLLRRRVDEVVVVFDGDAAGRRAAFRSLDVFLAEGFPARGVTLPAEHDPDSFVRGGGDLQSLVEQASPLMEQFLESLVVAAAGAGVDGTLAAVDQLVPRLQAIGDPVARDLYQRQAAELLGVDEVLLRQRTAVRRGRPDAGVEGASVGAGVETDPVLRGLLRCVLEQPRWRREFAAERYDEELGAGPCAEAIRFVCRHEHVAEALPLEQLDAAARAEVTAVLVDGAPVVSDFSGLLQRLQIRRLERQAAQLVRRVRVAEAAGDEAQVTVLLREQGALARSLAECRRRASAKGSGQ